MQTGLGNGPLGAGLRLTFPAAQNSVVSAVPPEAIGKASGTNSTMRELGGVLGIAVAAAVFAAAGGYGSPGEFADGFTGAMGVSAGLSLLAAFCGAALPRRAGASVGMTPALEGGR